MTGRRVGHFEILEPLGEGGMGVVYRARDLELNRLVAIKALPASAAADADRRQRFVREAQAASALNHPNIVTVYEIFRDEGNEFIAMELVDGKTIDAWLGPKGQRLQAVLPVAAQIASALAAAHEAGIVHRDLKPANVMVTQQGHVKVLDFGLAKLTERTPSEQDATVTQIENKTEKGTVLGTIAYMSPEQAQGLNVDWRSDIFSFGSLLYEMVTGRRAFQGASRMLTLAAVIEGEPAAMGVDVPRELQRLIARCLRKKVNERAQSLLDVKHSLEELRAELTSGQLTGSGPAAAPPAHAKSWWPVAVGAVLVIAAAALFFASRSPRSGMTAYKATPLTSYPGLERDPALSPDGKQVAFVWDGPAQDNRDIYVRRIGAGEPLRLTSDPRPESSPAWSRDGDYLAFVRGGAVYVIPALGGAEKKLCDCAGGGSDRQVLSWTADGKALVASKTHNLLAVQTDTGEARKIDLLLSRKSHYHVIAPAVSPDGKQLAFILADNVQGDSIVVAGFSNSYRLEGPGREILAARRQSFDSLAWASDGAALYFTDRKGGAPKLFRIAAAGGSAPELVPGLGEHIAQISVAGTRLVYRYSFVDENLWKREIRPDGTLGAPSSFQQSTRMEGRPEFSPDGSQIAFTSDRSGESEVWIAGANEGAPLQITRGAAATYVSWSPDGSEIVYGGTPEKTPRTFRVRVQGGAPRPVGPPGTLAPRWSADGKGIYFTWAASNDGGYVLQRIGASGEGAPVTIARVIGDASDYVEAPDGKSIWLLEDPEGGRPGLFQVPASGGKTMTGVPLERVRNYAAHRDGIYFVESGSTALKFYRYRDGKIAELGRFEEQVPMITGNGRSRFTVSPDGKTMVYTKRDQQIDDLMIVENFR